MGMLKAAVAIDRWKLDIFKRHLDGAGFSYTELPGPTPDTMFLKVETRTIPELQPIIEAAQTECAHAGKTKH